jgi:hypothetical protein
MQANFSIAIPTVVRKPSAALVCALLLAACNAKVIEPVRLVATPSLAPARMVSDLAQPGAMHYGVPDTSNVSFSPSAQEQVVDLTY